MKPATHCLSNLYASFAGAKGDFNLQMTTMIDLRSDTLPQPCSQMRAAIACAPVGVEVIDRDPTVAL